MRSAAEMPSATNKMSPAAKVAASAKVAATHKTRVATNAHMTAESRAAAKASMDADKAAVIPIERAVISRRVAVPWIIRGVVRITVRRRVIWISVRVIRAVIRI